MIYRLIVAVALAGALNGCAEMPSLQRIWNETPIHKQAEARRQQEARWCKAHPEDQRCLERKQ